MGSAARSRAPVVVAVDSSSIGGSEVEGSEVEGSAVGGAAVGDPVEWAAAEASAAGRPLTLLVAAEHGPALPGVLARVRGLAPELGVSVGLVSGPLVQALPAASRDAALLVAGAGTRGLAGAPGRVHCPLVVLRRQPVPRPGAGPGPGTGPRVVVAVRLGELRPQLVDFAFRAAAQRGVPLVAVHACTRDLPADLEGVCAPPGAAEAAAAETLAGLLGSWQDRHPEVPARVLVVSGDPADAVLRAATGAALLVVGAGGRRRVLADSVCRRLLHRDGPPLAVHPGAAVRLPAARGPALSRSRSRRPDLG